MNVLTNADKRTFQVISLMLKSMQPIEMITGIKLIIQVTDAAS